MEQQDKLSNEQKWEKQLKASYSQFEGPEDFIYFVKQYFTETNGYDKLLEEHYRLTGRLNSVTVGDKVCIEFTGGGKDEHPIIGIVTKAPEPNEYPEIEIDGEPIDLISEGHSSIIHKLNSEPEVKVCDASKADAL